MRAVRDTVIVRERADLDPGITDLVIPDIAKRFNPSVEPDHLCYGEVVSIGPGSLEQSRVDIREGDIVTFDLANVSHAFIEQGKGYQVLPQKALVERQVEGEFRAILDWVITTQDADAMSAHISAVVRVPDTVIVDGQRTETATRDGNIRMVYERVVSVGLGRKHAYRKYPEGDSQRLAYDDQRAPDRWTERWSVPDVSSGDLVAFCPSAATRFRRGGKFHRAVAWDEIHFVLGDG